MGFVAFVSKYLRSELGVLELAGQPVKPTGRDEGVRRSFLSA